MDPRRRDKPRALDAFAPESASENASSGVGSIADEQLADPLEMFPSETPSVVEHATTLFDLPLTHVTSPATWHRRRKSTMRSVVAVSTGMVAAFVLMLLVRPVLMRPTVVPTRPADIPVSGTPDAIAPVSKTSSAAASQRFVQAEAQAPARRSAAKSTTLLSRQSDNARQPTPRQARTAVAAARTPEPSSQRPVNANAASARTVSPAPPEIAFPLPSPSAPIAITTETAPAAESPRVAVPAPPVAPAATAPVAPAATAPSVASTSEPVLNVDTRAITGVLNRYQRAFSALDASAAHAVWPSVDAKALGRAFDQLDAQTIELQGCDITVAGARAEAACGGTARYVRKVGNKGARVEPRKWRFTLRQRDEEWVIDAVDAR